MGCPWEASAASRSATSTSYRRPLDLLSRPGRPSSWWSSEKRRASCTRLATKMTTTMMAAGDDMCVNERRVSHFSRGVPCPCVLSRCHAIGMLLLESLPLHVRVFENARREKTNVRGVPRRPLSRVLHSRCAPPLATVTAVCVSRTPSLGASARRKAPGVRSSRNTVLCTRASSACCTRSSR